MSQIALARTITAHLGALLLAASGGACAFEALDPDEAVAATTGGAMTGTGGAVDGAGGSTNAAGGGTAGAGGFGGKEPACDPPCSSGRMCTSDGCTPHWLPVSTVGAPSARHNHAAVWTGTRMLVWGGRQATSAEAGDGALYDPDADAWTPLPVDGAPSPREAHVGVWDGTGFVAWGGWNGGLLGDGARYDPASGAWTSLPDAGAPSARYWVSAVASDVHGVGSLGAVVWGGWSDGSIPEDGARFDPVPFAWVPLTKMGAPTPSYGNTFVATATELIVWGGSKGDFLPNGARYRPALDTWTPVSETGAPASRSSHVGVWTGGEMIVWGGNGEAGPMADGGRYDPSADAWTAMSNAGQPSFDPVTGFSAGGVWTGKRLLVWGPMGSCIGPAQGGAYDPAADAWSPLSEEGQPEWRCAFTVVWTGKEMIVWGGGTYFDGGQVDTGGRYQP